MVVREQAPKEGMLEWSAGALEPPGMLLILLQLQLPVATGRLG